MSIMKRKKRLVLTALITCLGVFLSVGIYLVVPKFLAGDTQVADLTLKSQVNNQDQTIQLTITDQNQADTKVVVPLTDKLSYTPTTQPHAGVTYDQVNHQIVIDWLAKHPKIVNLTVKAAQAGTYVFKVQTTRNDTPVNTAPSSVTVPPKESTPTSSIQSNNQATLSEKIAVPGLQEPDTPSSQSLATKQATQQQKNSTKDLPDHADTDIVTPADFDNQPWILYTLKREWNMDIESGKVTFGMLKKVTKLDIWAGKYGQENDAYKLQGYIPAGIKYLSALKTLSLGRSQGMGKYNDELNYWDEVNSSSGIWRAGYISGSIPPEIGQLKELEIISINGEKITGSIPAEISKLTKLRIFCILNSGEITLNLDDLSNLKNLIWLEAASARCSGNLYSISNLEKLVYINLSQCSISGELPAKLGQMKLGVLALGGNKLEGKVPDSFDNFDSKMYLNLAKNPGLYGLISNKLAGRGPARTGDLDLSDTQLTLKDPMTPVDKTSFGNRYGSTFMYSGDNNNSTNNSSLNLYGFANPQVMNNQARATLKIHDSAKPEAIQFFATPGSDMTGPLNIGIGGTLYRGSIELNPGHTFQITDSKGKLIYDGLAKPDFTVIPKKENEGYRILMDHTVENSYGITQINVVLKWIEPKTSSTLTPENTAIGSDNNIKYIKQTPFNLISTIQNDDAFDIVLNKSLLKVNVADKDKVTVDKNSFEIQRPNTTTWESIPAVGVENGYKLNLNGLKLEPKEKVKIRYAVTAKEAFTDTDVLTSETSLESGYKLPAASANMTIKNGQLLFHAVPDTMNFADSTIASMTTEIKRKLPDWKMQIEDTRFNKTNWHITANLVSELKNSNGDSLGDSVIFKQDGQPNQVINTTNAVDVYDGKATADDYQDVQWSADTGPALSVAPGLAKLGSYTGTMQWTLVDAPA